LQVLLRFLGDLFHAIDIAGADRIMDSHSVERDWMVFFFFSHVYNLLLFLAPVFMLGDLDFQVFESGPHIPGLLQVLFGLGGELLHLGQVALCDGFLDWRPVRRHGAPV
jgi:hypothetical protein